MFVYVHAFSPGLISTYNDMKSSALKPLPLAKRHLLQEVDVFGTSAASVAIGQEDAVAKAKAGIPEEVGEQSNCAACVMETNSGLTSVHVSTS